MGCIENPGKDFVSPLKFMVKLVLKLKKNKPRISSSSSSSSSLLDLFHLSYTPSLAFFLLFPLNPIINGLVPFTPRWAPLPYWEIVHARPLFFAPNIRKHLSDAGTSLQGQQAWSFLGSWGLTCHIISWNVCDARHSPSPGSF